MCGWISEGISDGTEPHYKLSTLVACPSIEDLQTGIVIRTVMLKQLVLVAALPQNPALLRTNDLPWAKIDGSFVSGILE